METSINITPDEIEIVLRLVDLGCTHKDATPGGISDVMKNAQSIQSLILLRNTLTALNKPNNITAINEDQRK